MEKLIILISILCFFGCNRDNGTCTEIDLGQSITLSDMTLVCIEDVEYTFEAKDERCPCGDICVWEGEFVLTFLDSDNNVVYTFNESLGIDNPSPTFGESLSIERIENEIPNCGDDSKIDEVRFTLLIE